MFKNVSAKDTATAATYLYLKAIGAKVTKSTVEETLKNHPEYPSLLAASDVLNKWNIENIALQISPEKLSEIPTPFLVYLQIDGGIFSVVKSIKENIVEWIDIKQKLRKISIEEFILMWNGIVLVAEVNGKSGEKNYLENYKKEVKSKLQNRLLFLSALLLISCFFLL